jgi:hypothetical protein
MPPSLSESHSQIRMRRSELVVDLLVKGRVSLSRTPSADRDPHRTRCRRMQLADQGRVEGDKSSEPPHLAHEDICGAQCRPVRPHKRSPRHRALPAWRYAVGLQDPSNRRPTNTMLEVLHGTLDPRIAPHVVLTGHAQNKRPDVCLYPWTAGSAPYVRTRATCQLAVPTQNRVRCRNGRHLHQRGASELVSEQGETSPFLITKSQASSAHVPPQHPVLFPQERDDLILLAQDPTAQGREDPPERRHAGFSFSHVRSSFGTVRVHMTSFNHTAKGIVQVRGQHQIAIETLSATSHHICQRRQIVVDEPLNTSAVPQKV